MKLNLFKVTKSSGKRGTGLTSDEAQRCPDDGDVLTYSSVSDEYSPVTPALVNQAVVDIGPTSNNGPGPTNVGVLNWSASPTVVVLAPGAGKFIKVLGMDFQYKPVSLAYVDPNANSKLVGLMMAGYVEGVSGYAFSTTQISRIGITGTDASVFPSFYPRNVDGASLFPPLRPWSENKALVFGFRNNAALELTTGDGHAIVTVQYLIETLT